MKGKIVDCRLWAVCLCVALLISPISIFAEESVVTVIGSSYEFEKNGSYEFIDTDSVGTSTNATMSIDGVLTEDGKKDGYTAYAVTQDKATTFSCSIDSSLLTDIEQDWHLVDDKSKKVGDITLGSDILKGAVIVQISSDAKKWVTVGENTNVFAETDKLSFYEASEIELLNGCYYRIIVAYEVSRRLEDSQILFVNKENYEYKKYADVFEFYLYDKENYTGTKLDKLSDSEKITLGKRIKTEDEGYTGQQDIDKDDLHYGWELGSFFVSGFTSRNTIDGVQYVLKNVGDTVTLGFYLAQDIDKLNDKETLFISRDVDGYDKAFEISPTDFGRGTLIVQYTDPDGVTGEPQIYTNYLEANLSPRANTAVMLCEEGDYDVALDYEIQNDNMVVFGKSVLPDKSHYRIAFSFSVRNSNCMVYTFDSVTGTELKNGNVTDNGFKIDLANSQYLDVSVKKEVLEDGADGLTEDTRFNRKAKDQEAYTDDGIYTITVKNKAAELESEKKIYVGTNKILKAYMVTGLSVAEIQNKVAQGATIADDGTIIEVASSEETTQAESTIEAPESSEIAEVAEVPEEGSTNMSLIAVVIVVVIGAIFVAMRMKKSSPENDKAEDKSPIDSGEVVLNVSDEKQGINVISSDGMSTTDVSDKADEDGERVSARTDEAIDTSDEASPTSEQKEDENR